MKGNGSNIKLHLSCVLVLSLIFCSSVAFGATIRVPADYGNIQGAINAPLDYLNDHLAEFPKDKTFYMHCAGGYRSVIAASILKSRGIHNVIDITEGMDEVRKTDIPTTEYVCPTSLK